MRSLLALILLILAVVALFAKQLVAFLVLAPLAWLAMRKAASTRDDLESFMGVCFVACVVGAAIEFGSALLL